MGLTYLMYILFLVLWFSTIILPILQAAQSGLYGPSPSVSLCRVG